MSVFCLSTSDLVDLLGDIKQYFHVYPKISNRTEYFLGVCAPAKVLFSNGFIQYSRWSYLNESNQEMLALVADGGANQWAIYKFTSFFKPLGNSFLGNSFQGSYAFSFAGAGLGGWLGVGCAACAWCVCVCIVFRLRVVGDYNRLQDIWDQLWF